MRPLKIHANEETSSSGYMQTKGPNVKRKRSDSNNCHQCHRNDKEIVVRCTKCKQKNYCIPCITKWYTRMQETDFTEACPVCRNICNCTACLQSDVANKGLLIPDLKLSINDKVQYSKYIVRALLPSLKQFVVEQNMEREEEARIQGLSITGLQLPKANFSHDDQVKCNNCKTSIFDIHRSCLNCLYKLCVTCCREIRDGFPWGNGQYRVHGVDCNFTTKDGSFGAASCSMDYAKWKLTDKGTIVCPPEGMGGCGHGNLELKSTYPDNWVSELLRKAESVAEEGNLTDALEAFEGACSCKEASRDESKVSYFHCPTVVGVEEPNQKHFQWHLYKGEPVIVPDVLSGTTGLSWEPLVMWRACRKSKRTSHLHILDFSVMNCLNWCEETINMHQFFKGYVEGLVDSEGRLKILKLEDWPPAESFQERLPRHFLEFIRCLPFRHYTHPHAGYLNMSAKIPEISLKPNLGPKICFGYGVGEELGFDSVTKLHYALSDRVHFSIYIYVFINMNVKKNDELPGS